MAWLVIMTRGGLRGALALVLALALPDASEGHDLIVVMTSARACEQVAPRLRPS